ncbi:MAG: TetR/AcrR family transcriptional regulator [Candidatus Nanopelagicales bacterium]
MAGEQSASMKRAATDADARRELRHQDKRDQIVVEAWRLAQRDGLSAISLRDLAAAVHMRQPSLYVYFESKAALYDAMFADGNRQLLAMLDATKFPHDPTAALVKLVQQLVRFSSENVVRHQLLFQRTIPNFEPSPEAFAPAIEFYGRASQIINDAGATEASDIELMSALISGLAHQQVANDPGGRRWEKLAARTVRMFLADIERRES